MTTAITDYGVSLSTGTGGPLVYTAIAYVEKITPPAVSQGKADYTTHDAAGLKKWIATGTHQFLAFGVTIVYDPTDTGHEALLAAVTGHTTLNLRFTWTDSGNETWDFTAIVESFTPAEHDASNPKATRASLMIQPTGTITITA